LTLTTAPETCVVYNGIQAERFVKATDKMTLRHQLHMSGQDFIVLYTGRLMAEKGIDKLLEAFSLLRDEQNVKLYVLGNPFFDNVKSDNEFTQYLKTMASNLGSQVTFTGYVPYGKVPQYVAAADVAVVPSVWQEPFGLTCIEAMAAGIPLITTKVGGIPEIVKGEQNILLEADDNLPSNLAKAIVTIKRHYSQFAGNSLDPRFTAENYAKAFFEALPQPHHQQHEL
jgi:glycosyltransferase involved in cell wall biosynthesis